MASVRSSSRPGATGAWGHRLRQGLAALRPAIPTDRDAILAQALTPAQAVAFCALPAHDQAHLCRVYRTLRSHGVDDRDLLAAALLHDLGKVAGRCHVRLVDRVARVLLRRLAPALLRRLARLPAPAWRCGLALAVNHAALGAARAAELGGSPRTCWLIAHHEDADAAADPDLQLLMAADRSAE